MTCGKIQTNWMFKNVLAMQTVPRTAQLDDLDGNEAKSQKKIDPARDTCRTLLKPRDSLL